MNKKTTPFNKLRKKERELRKNLIIDAAEKVVVSTPFDEISIRKIAAEAGISPSSIYNYFHDQEELFIEISQRRAKRTIELSKRIAEENDQEALKEIAYVFIDFFTYGWIRHFLVQEHLSTKSLNKISKFQRDVLDAIEDAFKKGKITDDPQRFSCLFLAAINGIAFTFSGNPGLPEEDAKKFMRDLASTLCDLIISEKDHKR